MNMGTFEAMDQMEMMEVNGGFSGSSLLVWGACEAISYRANTPYTVRKRGKNGGGAVVSYKPTAATKAYASYATKAIGLAACWL